MKLIRIIKIANSIFTLPLLLLFFSLIDGQDNTLYNKPIKILNQSRQTEQPILNPNRFQMSQGFTLTTSTGNNLSRTTGIYSNVSSYKLSERTKFNMGLHLIQNQNNFPYSSGAQTTLSYEFGLEYKLGTNATFSVQLINLSNSPIIYRNLSPFNVP